MRCGKKNRTECIRGSGTPGKTSPGPRADGRDLFVLLAEGRKYLEEDGCR